MKTRMLCAEKLSGKIRDRVASSFDELFLVSSNEVKNLRVNRAGSDFDFRTITGSHP
ncbi:hypothetical protein [Bradyrhizobium sp. 930_D9_N1_4]|uniref:hypothetical protein n=1 Tax=Bradyrhizobium sp. 930_D9_N1_4 TaxID=3240374 RepID=UPI003F89AC7C